MGRGAPNKKGLDYFPKMVDFYEDDRIFDLEEAWVDVLENQSPRPSAVHCPTTQ